MMSVNVCQPGNPAPIFTSHLKKKRELGEGGIGSAELCRVFSISFKP